jgi:voltage-gated potassium channel
MIIPKRLKIILLILFCVFICAILGYIIIEKWSLLEAVYMTVITLTTVGFQEVRPLSPTGRIFTMFILVSGIGLLAYAAGSTLEFIVEGELSGLLRRKRMEKQIQNLEGHYIICGAGDVGKYVIDEFTKTQREFVVVENNEEQIKKLEEDKNILFIAGNAAEDEILIKAGIRSAAGLISALSSDKDNLFVVLTARNINPNLRIISRAIDEGTVPKLYKAGADKVVSTEAIGGLRMASEMVRPTVVSFLDTMLRERETTLRIEETEIPIGSPLAGKTLREVDIPEKTGLIVVALKEKETEKYSYNPLPEVKLREKDILIVLGELKGLEKLQELLKRENV